MSTREAFEKVFRQSFSRNAELDWDGFGYFNLAEDNAWDLWCAAIQHEREECAKVAEDWYFGEAGEVNHSIAAAIRNREGK